MFKMGLKKGFTLAEVLTTLMVIGVVAAMTIPTLINSTDDQQHKVALKKGISVLSQALQLNIAKEIECDVKDSASLCTCLKNSMSGTCGDTNTTTNGTTLTTPDGMTFTFFFRGTAHADGDVGDIDSVCGTGAPTTEELWAGKGYACIATLDTNGFSKTTKSVVNYGNYGSGEKDQKLTEGTATKDQFPLILTGAGVYPAVTSTNLNNGARGYSFMYGSSSGTPWDSTVKWTTSAASK